MWEIIVSVPSVKIYVPAQCVCAHVHVHKCTCVRVHKCVCKRVWTDGP